MNGSTLALLLALLGPSLSALANELDAKTFREFDRDQDQVVTYLEFAFRMKAEFQQMDRSEDKVLTRQEHHAFHGLGLDKLDPLALADFGELDRDQNNLVTLGEFAYGVGLVYAAVDGAENGDRDERVTFAEYLLALDRAKISAAQSGIFKPQVVQADRKADAR